MGEQIIDRLAVAKARLLLDHPFFGYVVCSRKVFPSFTVPTAACTKRGDILINPDFAAKLSDKQLTFLLAHEVMHHVLNHITRRGSRDTLAWNWACDAVINETLIASGVGEFIDGGVRHPGADKLAAEDLYVVAQSEGTAGHAVGGIGPDVGVVPEPELTDAERDEVETRARMDVVRGMKAALQRGDSSVPPVVRKLYEQVTAPKVPWYDVLEQFMSSKRRDDMSWARPNRRLYSSGVYLPGRRSEYELGPVVIAVDTSGSIDEKMLASFWQHTRRIVQDCKPERVYVLACDDRIAAAHEFDYDSLPDTPPELPGSGGTSYKPVFEWIDQRGEDVDVLIYMTDGYGDQYSCSAPGYPVVWARTCNNAFPFGFVVNIV